ncbi:hypothetical protein [Ructibacterium gallinarum]|uniref:Uncharacterized protein n=1 Tax=Ructibacterium gallinarum TaxID=2779355 RepID=A0A9D5LY53_9FIRM|nr:hypothetical protein [Ructibacterium gallinarum]MBE5040128.1 hypothetical protein [Ructibacterium gallinarum]
MNFSSNAEEIRHYIMEFLSNTNGSHSRTEIFNYVLKTSGKNYTQGMLTGALKSLVDNNDKVVCKKRGWYELESINMGDSQILPRILKILSQTKKELNEACTVNLLVSSPKDLEITDKISALITLIDEIILSLK